MRTPNYKEAAAQKYLMQQYGFRLCQRKAVSKLPRAYISCDGQWRISTAPRGVWKMEKFICNIYLDGVGVIRKYGQLARPRFETPLAMAIWFDMMKRAERLGAVKL